MLGMSYRAFIRHQKMDDSNIPDFTALRAYDECHNIVEMKQPCLKLFVSMASLEQLSATHGITQSDIWNSANGSEHIHGTKKN
jgi:hypothetical protein